MAGLKPALIADNPWWRTTERIDADPDLVRFGHAAVRFEHPLPFRLDVDAVYTLRGPRQVGKSTLLKRLVRHLLVDRGVLPRQVLYSDVEGAALGTVAKLRNALTAYVAWARNAVGSDARLYLLLDEVTGVKDWGTVVRTLYRTGALTNVTVIATGSHALDLARGGEIAPGRRGEQRVEHPDWIMMPLGFRDYVTAHEPALAAALPALDIHDPRAAAEAAADLQLHGERLTALFDRYLLTGGYPHAMSEEQETGRLSAGSYRIYRDAITGQMRRAGHDPGLFHELVSWAADHRLGQEFSWQDVSKDTDVGTKDTARRYVEDAERLFLWHVLYRGQTPDTPLRALRSPKKLYPVDPFAWHVLEHWVTGDEDPWAAAARRLQQPAARGLLVESVAGDHLLRTYGKFALYHRHYQGHGSSEEIDFVLHRGPRRALLEVKYRQEVKAVHRRYLATHGGGIIATRHELEWHDADRVAAIPLVLLLAGYDAPLSLHPAPIT